MRMICTLTALMLLAISAGCQPNFGKAELGPTVDLGVAYVDARTRLLQAAESDDPVVRAHALEAMAFTLSDDAEGALLQGLSDRSFPVRFAAAMAVGDCRLESARPRVLAMIQAEQTNPNVRAACVYALHRLGDTRYTSLLGPMLFHGTDTLQANAALIMRKLNAPSAVDPLKAKLDEILDPGVELQIRDSLVGLDDEASVRWMMAKARAGMLDEQIVACQALGRARAEVARQVLRYCFDDDRHPLLRVVAAGALARLGDMRGYELCLRAAREPDAVLQAYYDSMGVTVRDDGRIPWATNIRINAATSLGIMDNPAAVDVLLPIVREDSGSAGVAAARTVLVLTEGYRPQTMAAQPSGGQGPPAPASISEAAPRPSGPAPAASPPPADLHVAPARD